MIILKKIYAFILVILTTIIYAQTDIAVNVESPTAVSPNQAFSYKIYVSNNGPTTATNVLVKVPSFGNFNATSIICKAGAGNGSSSLCPSSVSISQLQSGGLLIPSLPSGSAVVFSIGGTAGTSGIISNTATVSFQSGQTDLDLSNNSYTRNTNINSGNVADYTTTTYKMDTDATIALNNPISISNGIINIVFTLKSGDIAIPGIGNSFTLPVTYTKPSYSTNGWNQTLSKYVISATSSALVVRANLQDPTTNTNSWYRNLPLKNRNSTTFNSSSLNTDHWFTEQLKNSDLEALGTFKITIGNYINNLPPDVRVKSESIRVYSNNLASNEVGSFVKPIANIDLFANTNNATTAFNVMLGQTYTWRYTAFRNGTELGDFSNYGITFHSQNEIVFETKNITNHCVSGNCNDNTFLNTSDPNTIEYDNLISGYHGSIAKQTSGNYLIWGQGAAANGVDNLTTPTELSPANGYTYTGTSLKVAMGTALSSSKKAQYALLTTTGLYSWGEAGVLLSTGIKANDAFNKIDNTNITGANVYGLPAGVNPRDVKMMFGAYKTLSIVTCTGDAYVLSDVGNKNGDGSAQTNDNAKIWHRVMINSSVPLTRVVAVRGQTNALMALTDLGEIYTWGSDVYLGDGNAKSNKLFATKMLLPTGAIPKMIGMTSTKPGTTTRNNSYYLLATNGNLYSLGANDKKQLGIFSDGTTTPESLVWINVKSTNATTNMTNIAWISPNEHDDTGIAVVQALTTDGKLWSWGVNHYSTLGFGDDNGAATSVNTGYSFLKGVNPRYMTGGLNPNDKILAVETGGHISTIFKDCDYKLGYIGHAVSGSYASDSSVSTDVYLFNGAKLSNLCALPLPPYPVVKDIKICPGSTSSLADAILSTTPSGYTVEWYTTPTRIAANKINDVTAIGPGTYYVFYWNANFNHCTNLEGVEVKVSYYTITDPEFANCHCTKPGLTGTPAGYSKVGITVQQKQAAWPENIPNGWIALESKEKGMVITRVQNSNTITEAKEGMLIYDIDAQCVKLYNGTTWNCLERSCNE